MATLEELLGIDLSSPSQRRAIELAENDAYLIRDLIEVRLRQGISQTALADLLGVKQSSISAFERHDNDPKLSTIRRYAQAVGAIVKHSVERDREGAEGHDGWHYAGRSVTRGRFVNHEDMRTNSLGSWNIVEEISA